METLHIHCKSVIRAVVFVLCGDRKNLPVHSFNALIIPILRDCLWFKPPSNFIAGRPKAALLFWFFGGFRCGVPLFIVMLVIY